MFLLLKILVILTFHILSHPLKVLLDGETLKDQVVTLTCTSTHTFVHIYTHTQDNYTCTTTLHLRTWVNQIQQTHL